MKTHTNTLRIAASCAASLFLVPAVLHADDYTLAAGASETISTNATYGTMDIAGDLTIKNDKRVLATNAVNIVGGTVAITGNSAVFGHRANGHASLSTVVTFSPDGDGDYGKVTVGNGVTYGMTIGNASDYFNFSAKKLVLAAANEAAVASHPDGTFTFLELRNSGANFYEVENLSSLTGRVVVAGSKHSLFGKGNNYAYGAGFFKSGNFIVDVASGATLRFNPGNQQGSYNQTGCNVHVTGDGNLLFIQSQNGSKLSIRKGAVLDVTGNIIFDCSSTATGDYYGWFSLADSEIFGSNIGKIMTADMVGKKRVNIEVESGVAVTIHDLEVKRTGDALFGAGTIRIDATGATRIFEANIPATYGSGNTANTLTIAKTGANEAELIVTNLPSLVVEQGVARITSDCVIGSLSGAAGATLIADGCTVTLPEWVFLRGLKLDTANGGAFQTGSSRTVLYAPASLDGTLRISSGNLDFSNMGLSQKFMRWTFSKTKTSPNPLRFSKIWVFGADGSHVATGLTTTTDNNTVNLTAGKVCYEYNSSATNIAVASSNSWEAKDILYKMFSDELKGHENNYPWLASPVIDPENPDSWLSIALRRKDGEANATGYNMRIADHPYCPVSWTVEVSDDGQNWMQVDSRTDVTPAKNDWWSFYDGKISASNDDHPIELFLFSGYKSNGLEADATNSVTLQVNAGASVDLTAFSVAPQMIGGLTIDYATSGTTNTCGTIYGGSIASDGTLTVLNGAGNILNSSGALLFGTPLPVTLTGVTNADNLASWSIVVDGTPMSGRIRLNSNGHPVVVAFGTVLYFR